MEVSQCPDTYRKENQFICNLKFWFDSPSYRYTLCWRLFIFPDISDPFHHFICPLFSSKITPQLCHLIHKIKYHCITLYCACSIMTSYPWLDTLNHGMLGWGGRQDKGQQSTAGSLSSIFTITPRWNASVNLRRYDGLTHGPSSYDFFCLEWPLTPLWCHRHESKRAMQS